MVPIQRARIVLIATLWLLLPSWAAALPPEIETGLATKKFVYMSSTRKDGSLSKPAELWFLYHRRALYVASSPSSWRARRIKWGRPRAKIWVGTTGGPSFMATGAIVEEPEIIPLLMKTFAEKYPGSWERWEGRFRDGFKDGSRVLIKYTPVDP